MTELFETFRATIEQALDDEAITLADVVCALELAKADLINVMLSAGDDDDSEDAAE
jgi:hypothetical protein